MSIVNVLDKDQQHIEARLLELQSLLACDEATARRGIRRGLLALPRILERHQKHESLVSRHPAYMSMDGDGRRSKLADAQCGGLAVLRRDILRALPVYERYSLPRLKLLTLLLIERIWFCLEAEEEIMRPRAGTMQNGFSVHQAGRRARRRVLALGREMKRSWGAISNHVGGAGGSKTGRAANGDDTGR